MHEISKTLIENHGKALVAEIDSLEFHTAELLSKARFNRARLRALRLELSTINNDLANNSIKED
jgi:hypothetical protein